MPAPEQLLADAEQALVNGDYQAAAEGYGSLLALPVTEEEKNAYLGLGIAYLRDGEYASAVDAFEGFFAEDPKSDPVPDADFLLAEALVGAGDPLAAADRYRAYLAAGTAITAYVNEWMGSALHGAGDYLGAADAREAALTGAADPSFLLDVREKLALTYVALEDYPAAVAQYDAILNVARIDAYRARIEYQAAETLLLAGQTEAGYDGHLAVVEAYPTERHAYLSLVRLIEAGRPVGDFLRGTVDYYGGAYEPAVEAFNRYVLADLETHSGDAHWYAGLAYLALGEPDGAASEFLLLIETHPESDRQGDAWMGLAEAHLDMGDTGVAVETYRAFVDAIPGHRRAPEALWDAARHLEYAGDLEGSAQGYLDCHVRYPESDYGAVAIFRSGLQSYRLDHLVAAAVAWDTLNALYPDSPYRPAALLWLGKLRLDQGDPAGAEAAFREAVAADPGGYYGLRAADLRDDPLSHPYSSTLGYAPISGTVAEQAEAEEWLGDWLGLDADTGLDEPGPELAADPRLQRGLELWRLGHFQEARAELEALRSATRADALAQYQLALAFRDLGLYRSSILCAVRVMSLSPSATTLEAPVFIARLAYPDYYRDLVLQHADEYGLDPHLIFAQIRQESLFESLATSTASAQGLMQVIPPTGEQIAAELGWPPDYETQDLYRPYVSLRFGTYYLAQQRDRFDGRLDAALAAYNGGWFNVERWLEEAGDDLDLLLQRITFAETRLYLRRIKEQYAIYGALYGVEEPQPRQ